MAKKTKVDITPDTSLIEKIGATNFTLAEAVVELVANCLDARRHQPDEAPIRLAVDIQVDSDKVLVIDDASGMTDKVLSKALTLGVQMDKVLGKKKRKGMYGLGLKTAAASIGRCWAVHTRPMGENIEHFVEFDLAAYADKGQWTIEISTDKPDADSPLGNRSSGTAVVISDLRDTSPSVGAVLQLLGEAYKPHIADGDVITVNGTPAKAKDPDIQDSKVAFDEEVRPGWRVTGWVAIDKKTHNDGLYGFNLYREKQLIQSWDKSWIPAHLMTSRVIGEAHLDYMPVNFNKQGFKKQSEEWVVTTEHMKDFLKPAVTASRKASRGRSDEYKERRAIEGMKRALGALPEDPWSSSGDAPEGGSTPIPPNPKGPSENPPSVSVTHEALFVNGRAVVPTFRAENYGGDVTPWDYVASEFDGGNRVEVQAVLNTSSALFAKSNDHDVLGVLATADCVTRFLVEKLNVNPQEARTLRDRWIHVAILEKKEREGKGNE